MPPPYTRVARAAWSAEARDRADERWEGDVPGEDPQNTQITGGELGLGCGAVVIRVLASERERVRCIVVFGGFGGLV